METQQIEFKTGIEAVEFVGRGLHPDFNLDDPIRRAFYRNIYVNFVGGKAAEQVNVRRRAAHLSDIDPSKGIMLVGDLGVGKTTLMAVMQILFRQTPRRFKWVTGMELRDLSKVEDIIEIKRLYGKNLKMDLYIDDIGFGQIETNAFGNITNIIGELLMDRYDLFVREGYRTHLSSNVPTSVDDSEPADVRSLERIYGDRVLDRLPEVTNLYAWEGASLRHK